MTTQTLSMENGQNDDFHGQLNMRSVIGRIPTPGKEQRAMKKTPKEYEDKKPKRCTECAREAATNMYGRCAWCEATHRNAAQSVERLTETDEKRR